jgi:hypothetical protein
LRQVQGLPGESAGRTSEFVRSDGRAGWLRSIHFFLGFVDAAMNALVALASLFLLNTWATHRLFTTGAFVQRRTTFLAVTWLAPVMGALVALGEVRVHERELRLQRRWR